MTQASSNQFFEERRRTRRFFNRMSPLYPVVERHLFLEYLRALERIGLPPELCVLDLATGTGLLAGAFSECGHAVSGAALRIDWEARVSDFGGYWFCTPLS